MFKNYILIALRNLFSNKLFSAINLLGLSIGSACVIVISLYVINETSYDQHWDKADRTYRVMRSYTLSDGSGELNLATNAPQLGPLLKQDFQQLENVIRIRRSIPVISKPDSAETYYERNVYYADADVHEVFDIPMLYGDWEGALAAPFQLVLSESLARKYFDDPNPVGETLIFNGDLSFVVSGVMADMTENSHMSPEAFVSLETWEARFGSERMNDWGNNDYHTYVVTEESYDIRQFINELPNFSARHVPESPSATSSFSIIPIKDIHLHSHRDAELNTNGNAVLVYAFGVIAFLILVIAGFNFMNLSTARSIARAGEIGMRKVFGATRGQLVAQFLSESVLLTVIAVIIAIGISDLVLPWVNNLLNLDLELGVLQNSFYVLSIFSLTLVVGLLAGSYPAFYMADFHLGKALKGELDTGEKGALFRKVLIVFQFTTSIVLIIASAIAVNQIRYMLDMDLGLNTERIVVYRGVSATGENTYQTMKEELLRHPEILSVTAASLMPSDQNSSLQGARIEGGGSQIAVMAPLAIDYDFFDTFEIQFLNGRGFSTEISTDVYVEPSAENPHPPGAFILNESAVRLLGLTPETIVGQRFENILAADGSYSVDGPVVGVVEDTFFSSVREEVKPLMYRLANENPRSFPRIEQMAVKISGIDQQETIAYVEDVWQRFMPGTPIVQSFLEQNYAGLYQAEQRQGNVFSLFSVIAIFVAVMGLFGLASYLTERRTREIGIRKVLGSTILGIVGLISKDFCKLVVIANVVAWPIAWYLMNVWLQGFAYRTDIDLSVFLAAAMGTLAIAVFTVGSLAALTAYKNPVIALRHE